MNAVENIVNEVLEKGKKAAADYLHEEETKITANETKELTLLKDNEEDLLQKSLRTLEKDYQQQFQRQETSSRQATLHHKQEFLARLFVEAVDVMNQWDEKTYQEFCEKGMKNVPDLPESQVILGEFSKGKLTDAWLENINATRQNPLTFSTEVEKNTGGFVVSQKGIEYNFLFSSLVNEVKESQSFAVAEILFKES